MSTLLKLVAAAGVAAILACSGCTKPADNDHGGAASAPAAAAQTAAFYQPEYTADGQLKLPPDFEQWVYVGSPLTPNALNNGKANFPEFHNVYIQPGAYREYKRTGVFPEGCRFQKTAALNVRSRLHYSSGGVGSIRQRRAAAGHQRTQGGLSATGRSMRHRWPSRRGSESARIDLRCPTSH